MAQPDRLSTARTRNAFMRVAGVDAPPAAVIAGAQKRGLPATFVETNPTADADYAMVDGALAVAPTPDRRPDGNQAPLAGLGYAGFTPTQRAAFLAWLQKTAERHNANSC